LRRCENGTVVAQDDGEAIRAWLSGSHLFTASIRSTACSATERVGQEAPRREENQFRRSEKLGYLVAAARRYCSMAAGNSSRKRWILVP